MKRVLGMTLFALAALGPTSPVRAADITERPDPSARTRWGMSEPVRSVYSEGDRTLAFTGVRSPGGPMMVAIEYLEPGVHRRLLVSTHRFRDYESSLKYFLSNVDPSFLSAVRSASEVVINQLANEPAGGANHSQEKGQLALVEMGVLRLAGASSAVPGATYLEAGGWDCAKITLDAVTKVAACQIDLLQGYWGVAKCVAGLASYFLVEQGNVQGCTDFILKLICESNGSNWHFYPADPNVPGSHWDCYECNATCVVRATDEESGGGGGISGGREPEMQDPSAPGGPGGGTFGFSWVPGGTVGVCSFIYLKDGRVIIHCN
ncbi:MAG TPA: hypothetical protein PLB02_05745 [Thermoanaerobaculia bacterium]|nr:hypothetical protein [Thermoanaerobaculia bacterium]HQR66879.1 hypothetical protein [Thermoanaerobaculia bacterium]